MVTTTKPGFVCVFEGPDGVGKTTLLEVVRQSLATAGCRVLGVSFPGRRLGTLGAHINELHHRPAKYDVRTLTPDALQILHVAAHVDTIDSAIRPHVARGGIVLLDRYWWSTWVYGRLSGVNTTALTAMIGLERQYWRDLVPRSIFLLSRSADFIEPDSRNAFIEQSHEYFLLASRAKESPVVHISNNAAIDVAAAETLRVIEHLLHNTPAQAHSDSASSDVPRQVRSADLRLPYDAADELTSGDCDRNSKTALVWRRLAPATPTPVFDTYWRFAAERQEIFFRRFAGETPPWTTDSILGRYKFTNAYRASDRVSQYLIRHVIYSGDQSPSEIFFRVLLFKLFNRIETWQRLVESFGGPRAATFDVDRYDRLLTDLYTKGERLYSGAYIMPTGGKRWHDGHKHRMHLHLLKDMLQGRLPERIADVGQMQQAFTLLRACPTIGDFLAYQYVTDLNYSAITDFTEQEFVIAGPGARDGIRKCFSNLGGLTEADLIRYVCDRQQEEFEARGLSFKSLWGRSLQLIDCQNLFCEVDKYARVYHPEIQGRSGRARIKQQFRATPQPIQYWYPPKWGLNGRIAASATVEATSAPLVPKG
jgi:thymidylate kinase